jgi:hypothetical protein
MKDCFVSGFYNRLLPANETVRESDWEPGFAGVKDLSGRVPALGGEEESMWTGAELQSMNS